MPRPRAAVGEAPREIRGNAGVLSYGVISKTTPWLLLPPEEVVPKIFPCASTATLP
jgi:hypothetical protein